VPGTSVTAAILGAFLLLGDSSIRMISQEYCYLDLGNQVTSGAAPLFAANPTFEAVDNVEMRIMESSNGQSIWDGV
jgi:hypothetical protein